MIIELIILALAIPVGFLIAWQARDELLEGRKWFIVLIACSFLVGLAAFIKEEIAIGLTCSFMFIVSLISYWKSFDKGWAKKRFK
ncbi:MAG TPA: hypothetical protein VJK03_02590 [Candidatus Nanoarchaeia archaeon]|nr:hypothetical protein [Candidatus Nanoarchaeia archaeon]